MSKTINFIALFISILLISFAIFFKWHGDTTGRYILLFIAIVLQNLISSGKEKIVKQTNTYILILIAILIMILGFGFHYFNS